MLKPPEIRIHLPEEDNKEAARIRAMENRTGSVGDCTKLASYRSNKPGFFRRRSTRRRISNAQRLADLGDFINTRLPMGKHQYEKRKRVSVCVNSNYWSA
ncbi:hypothetical protein L3Y34_010886 [Caenorhabditis briggsae]|uniref:Uncharacterized protein n=1 Tax=Caenorhabditis briggsae TaxID=6238 RepID=A0AAE8ZPW6_CAEBR|nr:hypothetical protein L3Y34_010886 [Caenorhabditis briggsae]